MTRIEPSCTVSSQPSTADAEHVVQERWAGVHGAGVASPVVWLGSWPLLAVARRMSSMCLAGPGCCGVVEPITRPTSSPPRPTAIIGLVGGVVHSFGVTLLPSWPTTGSSTRPAHGVVGMADLQWVDGRCPLRHAPNQPRLGSWHHSGHGPSQLRVSSSRPGRPPPVSRSGCTWLVGMLHVDRGMHQPNQPAV